MKYFVTLPIIVCIILAYLSDSILFKFTFLALGVFLSLTIGLSYLNNLLQNNLKTVNDLAKKQKEMKSNSKSIEKTGTRVNKRPQNSQPPTAKTNYKRKVVDNADYKALIECFKDCMNNKLIGRVAILKFKTAIDEHLGEHVCHYTFDFDNDIHEIYVKLKNDCLTSKDYQELLLVLNNYKSN